MKEAIVSMYRWDAQLQRSVPVSATVKQAIKVDYKKGQSFELWPVRTLLLILSFVEYV